jgi:tetratricopeptide (TPR) repeat protein
MPHSDRFPFLNTFADALCALHECTGDPGPLVEAIQIRREALGLRPAPHSQRSSSLRKLANAFFALYACQGDIQVEALEGAIALWRELGELQPTTHQNRPITLNNLANALLMLYEHREGPAILNEAISFCREAVKLLPASHPLRCSALNTLVNALMSRFLSNADGQTLNELVLLSEEALQLPPANVSYTDRCSSLNNRANVLQLLYARDCSNIAYLSEAAALDRKALEIPSTQYPHSSVSLHVTNALLSSYEHDGFVEAPSEVALLSRELALAPTSQPDRATYLAVLISALLCFSIRNNDKRALLEAVSLAGEADAPPSPLDPASPHRDLPSFFQGDIANAFLSLAVHNNDPVILSEAIQRGRRALNTISPSQNRSVVLLESFANALSASHECDLDDNVIALVEASRKVLNLQPASRDNLSQALNNLSNVLLSRYIRDGPINNLNHAISLDREALKMRPAPDPDRSPSLHGLSFAHLSLYKHNGDINSLNEAVAFGRRALSLRPAPHPDRFDSLNNLAQALHSLYERKGNAEDLVEAISLRGEARALAPEPNRPSVLNDLSNALCLLYSNKHDLAALAYAITIRREILELHPPGSENRDPHLGELLSLLHARVEITGQEVHLRDLREMILEKERLLKYQIANEE